MVVADRFRVTDTLREVWRPLAALFLLDSLVTVAYLGLGWTWIVPAGLPLPLLGTGLAVFLGVRNNTAYARWWEARTLWGAVINDSRSWARALALLVLPAEAEALRRDLVRHQIAWTHALRCLMRHEDPAGDIVPFPPRRWRGSRPRAILARPSSARWRISSPRHGGKAGSTPSKPPPSTPR